MQTENTDDTRMGVVYRKNLSQYDVFHDGQFIPCVPSGNLFKTFTFNSKERVSKVHQKHVDPVAVGDRVRFKPAGDGTGVVLAILPRKNHLGRQTAKPMPGAHAFEQVIAANIDQVVVVFSAANPAPRWHLLDRILVSAEFYGIPALIVITKADLLQDGQEADEVKTVLARYQKIGYRVILTSALLGEEMGAFRQAVCGRISVLIGKSGVGKTSLLNQLEPDLGLKVRAVNAASGKGRHTTTHLEMFPLDNGGAIIDTPGVREFGLFGLTPEEVADCFPEMRDLLGQCRFGLSCQHEEEPGCAIRQAVVVGQISPYRYKSYLRLKADL